eukprot:comp17694_c0_seq1/m.17567 comp17694_c0_seq1/g.17567  ORF comp17694_c0_seq1/g.17567 comp17694_c0_seq1/m.17567 type:complete len:152 (-) comp17694_c0_seq1:787-1242(-)
MSQPQYTAPQLRAIITSAAGYDGWVEELARLARDHGLFDGLVEENGLPRRARLEGWHNELQTYTNEQRLNLNESLRKVFEHFLNTQTEDEPDVVRRIRQLSWSEILRQLEASAPEEHNGGSFIPDHYQLGCIVKVILDKQKGGRPIHRCRS